MDQDADSDAELVQCSDICSMQKTQGLQSVEEGRGQYRVSSPNRQTKPKGHGQEIQRAQKQSKKAANAHEQNTKGAQAKH